ncbi:MAG TPA: pyridoxamine 5'-phosphate oxidase family protein [Flavitalea sp.]|nr:pyridoxamine 5'-phosphate oxidase family protein [Flavitalea sp.]
MLGVMDIIEIEDVLQRQVVGRIGCHANDITYVVPISYAYDGTYIYGHTREGMKVDLMRINPAVCFQVDDMKDMANWKSVIAWGDYEELDDSADRAKALRVLEGRILPLVSSETTHLSPLWPFPANNIDVIKGIVFRIPLKKKTGRFENNEVRSVN